MSDNRRARRLAGRKGVCIYTDMHPSMIFRLVKDPASGFPKNFKLVGDPADPAVHARAKVVWDLDEIDRWIERRKALCAEAEATRQAQ